MFKVIIADDEPMALEAVKMAANWEEYGFKIAGECNTGEEALHLSSQIHPELIVTDIRMPDMDGLDLAQRVHDRGDDPIFILISGYDEFAYAKKALQIGIRHYILKPVIGEDFSAVLMDVLGELQQREESKKIAAESTEAGLDMFFENLLSDRLGKSEINDALPPDLQAIRNHFWTYAALYTVHGDTDGYDDLKKALRAYQETGTRLFAVFHDCHLYGLILSSRLNESNIWLHLGQMLHELFGENYYLAAGNPVHDVTGLPASVSEAETALEYRFFHPPGSILFYWEIKNQSLNFSFKGIYYMEEYFDALKNLDQDRISSSITTMFNAFRRSYMAPEIIKMYVIDIVYRSFAIIREMGGVSDHMPLLNEMNVLGDNPTLAEIEKSIREYSKRFYRYAQGLKKSDPIPLQNKVEAYIRAHYKRSLTVKEIAQKLYIHPTYLGSQIHKWFGCGFNEYLHTLRMKDAAQRITDTDMRIHEIATELGYTSYNSFLEQFVRHFSMKPTEYRKGIKK